MPIQIRGLFNYLSIGFVMKKVCVLGNAQLGRMLKQAGEPLGIDVYPVGSDIEPNSLDYKDAVITAEIERWPDTPFTRTLANHDAFINRAIFPIIADRLTQKQLLSDLKLPTANWEPLNHQSDWSRLFVKLGERLIIKRRVGGYDGRGQWRVNSDTITQVPSDAYQSAIVEQAINFDGELSLIGARNRHGEMVFYPLTHNLQQDGILKMSVAFSQSNTVLQSKAESMLSMIMAKLDYIGVMAMECFLVGDQLLINELAPRVHNSGHWTQNGASISQFELHLRAILDLALPTPAVFAPSVMVNLIGTPYNAAWLNQSLVHLHWYNKEVRPARKVGHLNLSHLDSQKINACLSDLKDILPDDYSLAIQWAKEVLQANKQ